MNWLIWTAFTPGLNEIMGENLVGALRVPGALGMGPQAKVGKPLKEVAFADGFL